MLYVEFSYINDKGQHDVQSMLVPADTNIERACRNRLSAGERFMAILCCQRYDALMSANQ